MTCPKNGVKEPNRKKKKLELPSEILKIDPHDKGPIPMPIGTDFMGQCPFLESNVHVSLLLLLHMIVINVKFQNINDPKISLNGNLTDVAKLGLQFCPAMKNHNSGKLLLL